MRRSYGQPCIVRWQGSIPNWHEPALGIEWDDPKKGKHSGSLDGIEYFTCAVPGTGSFIKASREADPETTFDEALEERYIKTHKVDNPSLSSHKVLEPVGFENHNKRTAKVDCLPIISLANCAIADLSCTFSLTALRRLDLSNNLFTDFSQVCRLISDLNVESLSLAGNRFDLNPPNLTPKRAEALLPCPHVKELDLSRTLINSFEVLKAFPNLETLALALNRLSKWPQLPSLPRLVDLDLSGNLISSIGAIEALGAPEQLASLNLAENDISAVSSPVLVPQVNLSGQALDWPDLRFLCCIDLFISAPLANDRPLVIAACPSLQVLNGTRLTLDERTDAEIYTLNRAADGKLPHGALTAARFADLVKLHGRPCIDGSGPKTIAQSALAFIIDGVAIRTTPDTPVQRLAAIACRRLHIPLKGRFLCYQNEPITHGTVAHHLCGGETLSLSEGL